MFELCRNLRRGLSFLNSAWEWLRRENSWTLTELNSTPLLWLACSVGELVGARLISHAGSLINLAKHPASTVQILGAEKALFKVSHSREGVQSIHEPRKLISVASWFAEWPAS